MAPAVSKRLALITLWVLTGINLLNYLDRWVVAGVMPKLLESFQIQQAQGGLVTSAFLASYIVFSPLAGLLGDRVPRTWLIAGGVGIWSAATVASGLADSYHHLLIARAFIGIGEAGYATVAPSLISDLFERDRRGTMLSVFYAATPIGAALGFAVGGYMAIHHGWRQAFFLAGAPGLLLAGLSLLLQDPPRGQHDPVSDEKPLPPLEALRSLADNRAFLINTAGATCFNFATGGLASWMPTFFNQVHGETLDRAGMVFGGITVISGFLGTALGGWAGDQANQRRSGGYLWVSGLGLLVGSPLVAAAGLAQGVNAAYLLALVGMIFIFLNMGPLNAHLVGSVGPHLRATAVALNIASSHLFGDALSPPLIGWLSDERGMRFAVAANALPLLVGGLLLVLGARRDGPTQ
jgi:MFS family permease